MTELAQLKKLRGVYKGSLTRAYNFVSELEEESVASIEHLENRLKHAKQCFSDFVSTETNIFRLDAKEESHLEEVEENYLMIIGELSRRIKQLVIKEGVTGATSAGNISENPLPIEERNIYNDIVKLPKCNIPPFSGDYMQWQSFYDLFTSAVHRKEYLSGSQKLQYLKGLLKGEAEVLLRHFNITDANYTLALQKLKDRYDRKRHTVNAFIKTFIEQPTNNNVSANGIRKLLDTSDEVIRGLKALGTQAEKRDPWIIFILLNKLDAETKSLWARESAETEFPAIEFFLEFLQRRTDELEATRPEASHKKMNAARGSTSKSFLVGENWCCPICNSNAHKLFECDEFKKMPVAKRRDLVRDAKRCFNCLNFSHNVRNCKSRVACRECQRRHHTLLHTIDHDNKPNPSDTNQASTSGVQIKSNMKSATENPASIFNVNNNQSQVILPTALVKINCGNRNNFICRALLDSSSQESFITEECAQRIGLQRKNGRAILTGLGDTKVEQSRGRGTVWISSHSNKQQKSLKVQLLVIPKITSALPSFEVSNLSCDEMKQLELADPQFNKRSTVDLLLGTEVYYDILDVGKIKLSNNLVAQNTRFGWTVAGKFNEQIQQAKNFSVLLDIDRSLRRFWELEDIPAASQFTVDEMECEKNFVETTSRAKDGKFIVALPFSEERTTLNSTLNSATAQLFSMEKKFRMNAYFKELYVSFMREYQELGHMREFTSTLENNLYYLPHHGVLKESSTTSKLRVVFNASFKSSSGKSLNDILKIGPSIQSSLIDILIRFRQHRFVMVGDIEKMYRQIWVDDQSAAVQNIVWRNSEQEPVRHFRLLTITYGTGPASFIATRCLKELAIQNKKTYPTAANIIEKDVYMDDLMTGANSKKELIDLRNEILNIMQGAQFNLRKWASNDPEIIANKLDESSQCNITKEITADSGTSRVLGVSWNAKEDNFRFFVKLNEVKRHTKRTMLSEASKVFDPLGWMSPVIVNIKILFQGLWLQNLSWDDELPTETLEKWLLYRNDLRNLSEISIARWLNTVEKAELHGFSDSSKLAYAAVIYIRVKIKSGWSSHIVAAKTKVAPIKQISIPRLELMGALMLTRLMLLVRNAFNLQFENVLLWTDSEIVLDWLSDHPRRWPTFVGNRTSEILQVFNREHWRYVSTMENPADIGSRGKLSHELQANLLWWYGPPWLADEKKNWPKQKSHYGTNEEEKTSSKVFVLNESNSLIENLLAKFNKYSKMSRVLAYIQRFVNNCKIKQENELQRKFCCLTRVEIQEASNRIIRHEQQSQFSIEYDCLQQAKALPKKSKILSLHPFLDDEKLIRVGGRISKSFSSFNVKHPIILAQSSPLSKAIILDHHERFFHAGIELTLSLIRSKFWIIRARDSVRSIIHKCVKCLRHRPKMEEQFMGDLPRARVEYDYPFKQVGVDYAGPFKVYPRRRRGQTSMKVYLCIFVCLSTKAVHIEVACELTTESFLGALKRFIARRGVCSDIYSDNGTNFIGANKQLKEMYLFLKNNLYLISSSILRDEINWHFNPPAASHMGGIYEAAVKSAKTHFRRVVGEQILTIEEFTTLITQIESIMNCRPICVSKSESDVTEVLTPAHFLIGRPLTAIPEPNIVDQKLSPLARWEVVKKMQQHFWIRWHRDYLTTLQSRTKWKNKINNLAIDDIVILKDENLAPNHWSLARVVNVHPGDDDLVRVVSIKTVNGNIIKRPIHKLCRLPTN